MKELIAFLLIIVVVFAAMPLIADQGASQQESFFQKASESLAKTGKPSGENPSAWVSVFQKASDNIATWNKTTQEAKSLSLRGNEDEIARRRNMKQ